MEFFFHKIELKCFLGEAAVSVEISNLLICFCSIDLSCPIFEKDNIVEHLYIVLFCFIKLQERDVVPW